jgi:drug/metabolite transporter (DMT)-like permease
VPPAETQLEAIHAMLASGHRSVRLERHTLLLWGLGGGVLCAASDQVLTAERFPGLTQRALALLAWLIFWLGSIGWLDHRLTRRVRRDRAETLPFAQAQITRAWWMLMAMGALGSFAMFFYGGGSMVYALWTILLGLGIYLFGLFSRPLTEWIGLAVILIGVAGLAAGLPFGATRWLAAACFAIGMPLAGWMAERDMGRHLPGRALALATWLAAVTAPALAVAALPSSAPEPGRGDTVVRLPAGTAVALKVDLASPELSIAPDAALPMVLDRSVEVVMKDGMPDGRFRFAGDPWRQVHDGVLQLRIFSFRPALEAGKPIVRADASFDLKESNR